MLDTDFLNDVAVYLVVSPLAAFVVAVIALVGWGLRRGRAPAAVRHDPPLKAPRIAE
jgi:hypothetical protein